MADRSEMARNAIESDFRPSKMSAAGHFVKKFRIYLKWDRNAIESEFWTSQNGRRQPFCQTFPKILKFRHPKWPMAAIMSKIIKNKVAYRSEMPRNAMESEFQTSKMGADGHFVKKKILKFRIDLKWPEIPPKVNFGNPKWPTAAILPKEFNKKLRIDFKWPEMRSKVNFGHPEWAPAAILYKNSKTKSLPFCQTFQNKISY